MRYPLRVSQTFGRRKPGRILTAALIAACAGSLLSACGGSSDSTPAAQTNSLVALTPSYQVEYDPGATTAIEGKTTFTIKVTPSGGGNPVGGASIALMPLMHMTGMTHTTPFDTVITENPAGTYHCTVYFLMPTMGSGYWELKVGVNGDNATLQPPVAMAMPGNSAKAVLKGQNDNVAGMMMGTEEHRTYYLFRDKLTGMGGTRTFGVFLAAKEGMMNMPPLVVGGTLHDETNAARTVSTIAISASIDNGVTWVPGTNTGGARWEFSNLGGFQAGTAREVRVQLIVNSEQKTTDGNPPSGTGANDYAIFTVTPM